MVIQNRAAGGSCPPQEIEQALRAAGVEAEVRPVDGQACREAAAA